jgi:DNA gyrase/topoisomerase IV subunit A
MENKSQKEIIENKKNEASEKGMIKVYEKGYNNVSHNFTEPKRGQLVEEPHHEKISLEEKPKIKK